MTSTKSFVLNICRFLFEVDLVVRLLASGILFSFCITFALRSVVIVTKLLMLGISFSIFKFLVL